MPVADRTPTGVDGLDAILGGGLLRSNTTVLVGPVGSGKTTFGLHFVCAGATRFNEPGIVVLFEVSPDKIVRDAASFGWDLVGLEQDGRLKVLYTTRQAFEDELKQPDSVLLAEIRELGAKRVFIDGYGLQLTNGANGSPRDTFHVVLQDIQRACLTPMIAVETSSASAAVTSSFEQFLADAVIRLGADYAAGALYRSIEITKSRGHAYVTGRHSLEIRDGHGVVVYARANAPVEATDTVPHVMVSGPRLGSGVPGLDSMLGGGYLPESATLVVGASGVGKSVCGLQYLAEGRRHGERGVFISLDEPPHQIRRNAASIGIHLGGPSETDGIHLHYESSGELVLDRHFARVDALLREVRPTRVVMDSVSGYAPLMRGDEHAFRDFLVALVALMKRHHVTVVLNHENPELAGMSSMASHGAPLSSTVDNIILLNWVELGDEYRLAITVAKARASEGTRITRECQVTDGIGMRVLDRVVPAGIIQQPFARYRSLTTRSPERSQRQDDKRGNDEG